MDNERNALQAIADAIAQTNTNGNDWRHISLSAFADRIHAHLETPYTGQMARRLAAQGIRLEVQELTGWLQGTIEINEPHLTSIFVTLN
jgi:hypothetical protein